MMPKRMTVSRDTLRHGISLHEMLAAIAILGILAMIALPRLSNHGEQAKTHACHVQRGNIEIQAQLWFRNRGTWPANDLSDLGAHSDYFPEGLPACPVDGSPYQLDSNTHRVLGHAH
jgi:prepilin-type N-terminal cleavage/methylation domain-containing protein